MKGRNPAWGQVVADQAHAAAGEGRRLDRSGDPEAERYWNAYFWLLWIAYPTPCAICGDVEDHGGRSHSLAVRGGRR